MGVKKLNKFINTKCRKCIKTVPLKQYENKKIVIDINNYLYRYKGEETFIDSIFQMCSLFYTNNILPVFIFDGRTRLRDKGDKKYDELKRRIKKKDVGDKKLKNLEEKLLVLKSDDSNIKEKCDTIKQIEEQMKEIKLDVVRIKKEDIKQIKELISAFNMVYYDAPNEADEICAYLCKNGVVDACLSEDSDMFIYGCPVILKRISLLYGTVKQYKYDEILDTLKLDAGSFTRLCILSGTDYNTSQKYNKNTIFYYYKKQQSFLKINRNYLLYKFKLDETMDDYKDRVLLNEIYTNYTNIDSESFSDVKDLYFMEDEEYDIEKIKEILSRHNYYFV